MRAMIGPVFRYLPAAERFLTARENERGIHQNQDPEFHRALRLTGSRYGGKPCCFPAIFLQLDWELRSRYRSSGSGSTRPLFGAPPTRFLL